MIWCRHWSSIIDHALNAFTAQLSNMKGDIITIGFEEIQIDGTKLLVLIFDITGGNEKIQSTLFSFTRTVLDYWFSLISQMPNKLGPGHHAHLELINYMVDHAKLLTNLVHCSRSLVPLMWERNDSLSTIGRNWRCDEIQCKFFANWAATMLKGLDSSVMEKYLGLTTNIKKLGHQASKRLILM